MFKQFFGWMFFIFNRVICSTLNYKIENEPRGQSLFAFWHGKSFPLFFWGRHRKLCLFPTTGWRGDLIDYLAKKYGYQTIRFTEKATPLERSVNLEKLIEIIRQGYDVALAIDGPPKPLIYHKAKPGILFLSQKTGVPIVPVGIKIKSKVVLFWRWDRYEIPLPWSKVELFFGKPLVTSGETTTQELEEVLLEIDRE